MGSHLRRVARGLRHLPDRLLHAGRRTRATRRLVEAGPHRLLVLCMGNICRSPYAAGVLGRELPDHEVRSAGFFEAGRRPPRHAVSVAAGRGVNLTGHLSAQVTSEWIDWADLVVVMDGAQAGLAAVSGHGSVYVERLGDFDPGRIETRTLIDPIDRDREFFTRVYERIDACCATVAAALLAGSPVAHGRQPR